MAKRKGNTYRRTKAQLIQVSRAKLEQQLEFLQRVLPSLNGQDRIDAEQMITALTEILEERSGS